MWKCFECCGCWGDGDGTEMGGCVNEGEGSFGSSVDSTLNESEYLNA